MTIWIPPELKKVKAKEKELNGRCSVFIMARYVHTNTVQEAAEMRNKLTAILGNSVDFICIRDSDNCKIEFEEKC